MVRLKRRRIGVVLICFIRISKQNMFYGSSSVGSEEDEFEEGGTFGRSLVGILMKSGVMQELWD